MALIRNAIVKMDWESNCFFENKSDDTFVAAVKEYTTGKCVCPIVFKDNIACILFDDENDAPFSVPEITKALAEMVQSGRGDELLEEVFEDPYIEVCRLGFDVDEDIKSIYGLSDEQCEDIVNRLNDLSGYYVEEDVDM